MTPRDAANNSVDIDSPEFKAFFKAFMEEAEKPDLPPWVAARKEEKKREKAEKKAEGPTKDEIANDNTRLYSCGKRHTYTIVTNGEKKVIVYFCGVFRQCDNCRLQKYEREIEDRLHRARTHLPIGANLQFLIIKEEKIEAIKKRISRAEGDYYSFPQASDLTLIIHNAEINVKDDENWKDLEEWGFIELDDPNEYDYIDIDFNKVLKDVPENKRITGDLGKKREDEEEEKEGNGSGSNEDEDDGPEVPIKKWYFLKEELTKREVDLSYDKAVAETQGLAVTDPQDLESAMFLRVWAWAKQHDAPMFYEHINVTNKDIKAWNDNSQNVRIVRYNNDKDITHYPDKNAEFEAFMAFVEGAVGDPRVTEAWDYVKSHWKTVK